MLAEEIDAVIGVDTHRDTHTAALLRPTGTSIAATVISTDPDGFALLCARLPTLDGELADKLAAELGDLPLARGAGRRVSGVDRSAGGGLSAPLPRPPGRPAYPRRRGGLCRTA